MKNQVKSGTLRGLYKTWQAEAPPEQIAFVDEVFTLAESHYSAGGDVVVETMTPCEILEKFKTTDDVKKYCGIWVERNLNARCGEDDDPQLEMARKYDSWMSE